MALTATDVANMALLNVGSANKIAAGALATENTKEARMCNAKYGMARDQCLADPRRDWTFGRKRAVLAASANPVRDGFTYIYTLPSDVLHVRRIWNGFWEGEYPPEMEIPYRIEPDDAGTGRVLLCNVEPITSEQPLLFYTRKMPNDSDIDLWSNFFLEAVAWELASKLVMPSAVDVKSQAAAAKEAERFKLLAIWEDRSQEKRTNLKAADTFTRARRGGLTPVIPEIK